MPNPTARPTYLLNIAAGGFFLFLSPRPTGSSPSLCTVRHEVEPDPRRAPSFDRSSFSFLGQDGVESPPILQVFDQVSRVVRTCLPDAVDGTTASSLSPVWSKNAISHASKGRCRGTVSGEDPLFSSERSRFFKREMD